MTDPNPPRRSVRSYVQRAGRVTSGQRRALSELWERFGVEASGDALDLDLTFGRRAPRVLEIGYGDGTAITALAAARPECDFLGIEVHAPGIGHCLRLTAAAGLTNLRLIRGDAAEVLRERIAPRALVQALLWFPDPWPKKRHHKRRLIQPEFAALLASRLASGGRVCVASDWEPYAEQIRSVLTATAGLANVAADGGYVTRPERVLTRFEARGARLGHRVRDLEFVKV
jgi:tRNA (guanine-N7-)-methyltransferase